MKAGKASRSAALKPSYASLAVPPGPQPKASLLVVLAVLDVPESSNISPDPTLNLIEAPSPSPGLPRLGVILRHLGLDAELCRGVGVAGSGFGVGL